ncbi:MAG: Ig-like domain-containing protein, partial [Hyphomicrobiales bacterium]|nr:Ig-like domain-containing protein [Hyphomicrobiales bacterium]
MTLTPGIEQLEADVTVIQAGSGDITVGDGTFLFNAEFTRSGGDLTISGADGAEVVVTGYFDAGSPANLLSDGGAMLSGELVDILAGPLAPGQYAQATGAQNGPTPIGTVVSATGNVAATRADGSSVTLADGAPVFTGDVILTATGSTVSMVFLDGTVFNMAESARMVLNNLVYEQGGSDNSMLFSILQGGFSFFAGQIAPTGDMQVTTPVATLGIRGTSPWVFSFDGITFEYSILVDPLLASQPPVENVGSYILFSLIDGQPIATVFQTSTKFVLNSPSAIPQEVTKTPDELAADLLRQRELTNAFNAAQPFLQQLQGPGGGQQRGDIDDGTQQDTSAPVPAAGPDFTQIQSSGINAASIAVAQAEDIGQTETTTGNSFALDPFNSSGSGGLGGSGLTSNELLSETSDGTPPIEPVTDSGGTTPPPEETFGAPIIILPDAPTITEDTSIVLNGFSIQDSSGSTLTVEITAQSTVTLASVEGLTFLVGDGVDDEFLVFEGSAEAINNALNGMTYIPTADNEGVGGIDITVSNSDAQATSSLTVVIEGENDAPVANDDAVSTDEDTPLTIDVLANDFDVDGDQLTVTDAYRGGGSDELYLQEDTLVFSKQTFAVSSAIAVAGSVTINEDGTLNYTPPSDFTGTDTITYTIDDGNGGTDTGTVTVTVNPVNDAPVANDDAVSTDEDTPLTIDVLANDTDPDRDELFVSDASADNGTVTINEDGTLNYTPTSDFNGTDTIAYTINDGNGGTDTGTVTVTVNPVNDAPVANDDAVSTDEDTPLTIDVLANDVDIDGDQLTVTDAFLGEPDLITSDELFVQDTLVFTKQTFVVSSAVALAGSVIINEDGTLNYTPPSDFNGTDTITYTIEDGNGGTDTGTVTVTVN